MAISVTDISALPADRAAPAQHFAWMLRVVLDSRLPIHEFVNYETAMLSSVHFCHETNNYDQDKKLR